jgi:hypothetical protein
MTIEEFIKELKPMVTVKYSPYHKRDVHYMGSTILMNKELDAMLERLLGESYTELNYNKRKKIRQRVFKECINDE